MNQQETMRVPLRERNKQRVIQRIQEGAFELFRTVGYEQTTMDAIAEKAETSRGTVFKYFPCAGYFGHPFSNKPIFACFCHNAIQSMTQQGSYQSFERVSPQAGSQNW